MMRIKKSLYAWVIQLILTSLCLPVYGAFEYPGLGWSSATGNIKVLANTHPGDFGVNPCFLLTSSLNHYAIQYQKPFKGMDLHSGSIAGIYEIKGHRLASSFDYFGDDIYSEMRVSTGSYVRVEDGFSVGATVNYHLLQISGFESMQSLSFSPSIALDVSENTLLASAVEHLLQLERSLPIPQKFHFGVQHQLRKFSFQLAVEKEAALQPELCMGVIFSPRQNWETGFGYRDMSGSLSVGWRIISKSYGFNYSCTIHPELPLSQGVGLEVILP